MGFEPGQTALIIPVAAAEPAVQAWRARFDGSAPFGVPAHLTVLFPFVPTAQLTGTDLFDLRSLFALQPPIEVTLAAFGRFPGVLYLDPEPAAPLRALTRSVLGRWPDHPPYGGQFGEDVIPHLTVAETADEELIAEIRADVARRLPIAATLTQALLLRFDGDTWVTEQELPFGA